MFRVLSAANVTRYYIPLQYLKKLTTFLKKLKKSQVRFLLWIIQKPHKYSNVKYNLYYLSKKGSKHMQRPFSYLTLSYLFTFVCKADQIQEFCFKVICHNAGIVFKSVVNSLISGCSFIFGTSHQHTELCNTRRP